MMFDFSTKISIELKKKRETKTKIVILIREIVNLIIDFDDKKKLISMTPTTKKKK